MVFNSLDFIVFFPIVILIFYILPQKIRYIWLLIASYYFYMCWNAVYGLLLLYSTAMAYAGGLLLEKSRRTGIRRLILTLSLLLVFAPLFYYKYTAFLLENLNSLMLSVFSTAPFSPPDILLPIGISFFTFQAAGYVIDVYRDTTSPEKNPLRFALFVSFFPQLVAGPIERSKNLLAQLDCDVKFDFEKVRSGLWLMLWGYAMKVVIADRIAIFVDCVYDSFSTYNGVYLIIASALFAIQIYCDFAGYSTIAVGAARILGIKLVDNFKSPYLSCSVTEFWKRWHISLTSWFKDYLYIPMGGNRKGRLRKNINKFVVFTISGLWHGAEWSFAAWGALNGLFLIIEDMLRSVFKNAKAPGRAVRAIGCILTFILVDITWIFFRAKTIDDALYILTEITHTNNWNVLTDGSLFTCGLDIPNFVLLILAIVLLFVVDGLNKSGISMTDRWAALRLPLRSLVTASAIALILLFGIWGGTYKAEAFIYFQF